MRVLYRIVLAGSAVICSTAGAELAQLQTAPLVTPSSAWTYYGSSTTHTYTAAAWATTPAEIVEVANALDQGGNYSQSAYPLVVYEYVRNNIAMDFRFGMSKGARGAIIDQSGTAFDQAHLMVALLRQQGITANYQVGTLTLTGAQFQSWTGLTNAPAACQYLADGGIPATVNGATSCSSLGAGTTVSSVVMAHVWVTVNGTIYDPAYKVQIAKTGIDVAAAMGCGTHAAPTCGTTILGLTPTPATVSGTTNVQYIQSVNQTGLESQLNAFAISLQHSIQATNAANSTNMLLTDVLGALLIDVTQPTTAGTLLPTSAYSTPTYTWTGDIPDQFRTSLSVSIDNISNFKVFADEIAGSRLRVWGTTTNPTTASATRLLTLYLEYLPLATSSLAGATGALVTPTLVVQHPYAANSGTYASQTLSFQSKVQSNLCEAPNSGCTSSAQWFIGVLTILQGWGESTLGTSAHAAMLQKRDATNTTIVNPSDPKHIWITRQALPSGGSACLVLSVPTGPVLDPGCYEQEQGPIGAQWLAEASAVRFAAGQINGALIQHHHSLGILTSGASVGGTVLTAQAAVSVNSTAATATDRTAAFLGVAAAMNRLEGGVLEQTFDAWEGGAAASVMTRSNSKGIPFYNINSANVSTASSLLTGYSSTDVSTIQSYANAGWQLVVPQNGAIGTFSGAPQPVSFTSNAMVAFTPANDQAAYLIIGLGLSEGAGGTTADDPAGNALSTTKLTDYARKGRKQYGVDLHNGDVSLTPPPDLETGTGVFPAKLSYQRVYEAEGMAFECQAQGTYCYYSSFEPSLLPGGWTHSLALSASTSSDGLGGLGRDTGVSASQAIAALYVLRTLDTGGQTFQSELASVFVANWLGEGLNNNSVVVKRPPAATTFLRLPDGTFDPGPGKAEILTQTGTRTLQGWDTSGATIWNVTVVSFTNLLPDGSTIGFQPTPYGTGGHLWSPTTWQFPSGVTVTFNFEAAPNNMPCLSSVTNNLGRSLTMSIPGGCGAAEGDAFINGSTVQDDAGRTVTLTYTNGLGLFLIPATFSVTGADGGVTTYGYLPYPNTAINRPYARIYQWFTPLSSTVPYITIAFDSLYRAKTITDNALPVGNVTTYYTTGLYGAETQIRAETVDPLAAVTTDYHNRWGQKLLEFDPLNRATSWIFDAHRRLVQTTFPEGNYETRTYDIRHNLLSKAQTPKVGSSLAATLTSTTYLEGPTVLVCVHPVTCNRPATDVDANRNVTNYGWSSISGLLTSITRPSVPFNGGTASPYTSYTYTPTAGTSGTLQLLTSKFEQNGTPGVGRTTTYSYNPLNKWVLMTKIVDANDLNLTTNFTFDGVGNIASIQDPDLNSTAYLFDAMRRLTTVSAPLSALTRYCYDADGELVSTNRGRTSGLSDPNASAASGLSANGQCTNPYPSASWQTEIKAYYPTGYLLSVTDANLNQTIYAYDPLGRERVVQDPDGRQTSTVYDAAGQSIDSWRGGSGWLAGSGTSTSASSSAPNASTAWTPSSYTGTGAVRYAQYAYSPNGKQITIADADNHSTSLVYDGLDRLRWTLFPDPSAGSLCTVAAAGTTNYDASAPSCSGLQTYEQYGYDANANRLSLLTRRGDTVVSTYDAINRMLTKAPAGQGSFSYGYDLLSQTTSVVKAAYGSYPSHTTTYTYDGAGRKATEVNDSLTVGYQYDPAGNRTRTTWPDGYYVSYQYDALNRMTKALELGTTELGYFSYDTLSRRQFACFGGQSAICGSTATNQVAYTYEPDSMLSTLNHTLNGTVAGLSYAHNHSRQLTQISATDTFYLPEPAAAASTTYVPNDLNQYASVGGVASSYDGNGNLLSWSSSLPTAGVQTYTFDSENRLVTAAVGGSSTATIAYDYDALGRRYSKTVSGTVTRYLLDADEEIAEMDGSNNVLRRFVTASAIDDRIADIEGSNTSPSPANHTYFHLNHQGSVIAMTDATGNATGCANGTLCQRLAYDEYGNLSSAAAATGQPYRFTGRRYDPETGLYYYRARYYSPQLGRFLQVDPVGYKDDVDLYTYVGNDPLDKTDPSGLAGCADASGQGLSGQCIQASNFKESKSSGKTVVNTPGVDKAMVAAAPSIQTVSKDNPAEKAVAVTQNADGTTTTTSLKTETKVVGNTYESKVSGIPQSATGIEHSHPNDTSTLTPGPKDNAVVSQLGKTNGITNNGNVGVLEQSGGQYRFRVIQGSVGDAGEVQGVLNQFQRQDQ